MKRGLSLILFILLFGLSPVPAQIPVQEEPFHQPVYQDGTMRILRVALAPGDTSLFHRHSHNIFYATLKGTRMWLEGADGLSREVTLPDGWTGADTTYAVRPFVHRIANVGRDSLVLFAVESFRPPRSRREILAGDSVFYARRHYLAAGEEIKLDISGAVVLIVLKGRGELRTGSQRGPHVLDGKHPWCVPEIRDGGYLRNMGNKTLILVEIRLNRPLQQSGR